MHEWWVMQNYEKYKINEIKINDKPIQEELPNEYSKVTEKLIIEDPREPLVNREALYAAVRPQSVIEFNQENFNFVEINEDIYEEEDFKKMTNKELQEILTSNVLKNQEKKLN